MLLKSIKLQNFRQFIHQNEIEFSIDPGKNVSIILGENGSGKTSLAQAFTWCLYGITDFKDTSMLNKVIETNLLPGNEEKVRVDIHLIHENTEYHISRIQTYKKRSTGQVTSYQPEFHVAKKIKGQQEFSKTPELDIKQILPKELAGYFFLNGEHIEKLNKELSKGKSQEFATAVENLLGLKAFLEAIDHFNPRKKHSVIGSYNAQYDGNSNNEIITLRNEIQDLQDKLQKKQERLDNIASEIELGEESCDNLEAIIRENQKSADYQLEIDSLNKTIEYKKKLINEETALVLGNFNKIGGAFFSKSLIADALVFLASEEVVDKGIPEIHEKTIEFLVKRGYCICGTKIVEGESPHDHLIETLEFIPPKSIGTVLSEFVNTCDTTINYSDTFFKNFKNQYSHIRTYENEIDDHITEIENLTQILSGMKKIGEYQSKLSIERERVDKLREEERRTTKDIGALEAERDRKEKMLTDLALKDSINTKIEIYKTYAIEIYEQLMSSYQSEETKVRELLEEAVNDIFKKIYEGGMSISVDEKYRIKVTVDEVKGFSSEIETSTAQSTSVIFAFIAGIIKLAKEFSSAKNSELELLATSEPYPLLMDAPLSNFDKRRIQTVCDTLPKVAEQVIVFIKDTDGDIAEEHLGSIIGKRYKLKRDSEVETYIVGR